MARWRKGEGTINALLERGNLQKVTADSTTADALVATSERDVQSATTLTASDPEAAFSLAYDAARKAATALLAHQGLRPTTAGGHIAGQDAEIVRYLERFGDQPPVGARAHDDAPAPVREGPVKARYPCDGVAPVVVRRGEGSVATRR